MQSRTSLSPQLRSRLKRSLALASVGAVAAQLSLTTVGASAADAAPAQSEQTTTTDSVGNDFWLAFPKNVGDGSLTLSISGAHAGSGTVTMPGEDFSQDFTVTPGEVASVSIPPQYQITATDGLQDDAIHVTADTDVAVYGINQAYGTSGAFLGLPVDSLGQRYRAIAYQGLGSFAPSQITVVATADDTDVTITPQTTVGAHEAGTPYTVQVDKGQVYSVTEPQDVTGTVVESSAPVSVFSGTQCSNIPTGEYACDSLVQQIPPTSAWGTDFLSVRFASRNKGDTYRVLANEDDTDVTVNGDPVATLSAGEFWEGILPGDAIEPGAQGVSIQSSKPTLVAQYGNGSSFDRSTGDPMMMLVPPAGQYLDSYTFAAPSFDSYQSYASLIVPTADIAAISLDGELLPAEDFAPIADSGYSGAQLTLAGGTHNVDGPDAFGLNVYEWGFFDGFGFPGGMAMKKIYVDPQDPLNADNLTSTGTAPDAQQATITIPDGGSATLLDGESSVNEIDVDGVGAYVLDPETGIITFTPAHGYSGTAAGVTYQVTDGEGATVTATYTPTVNAPAAPSPAGLTSTGKGTAAQSATAVIPEEGSVTLLDGEDATSEVVVDGVGTYLLDTETGVITFVPASGYSGTPDGVTYQVTDLYGQSSTAVYTPTVELPDAPTAMPMKSVGNAGDQQGVTVAIPVGGGVGLVDQTPPAKRMPSLVTRVFVDGEGTYNLDTESGGLTFDPVEGFTGKAGGVAYVVTDSYGQSAQSTYTPRVRNAHVPQARFHVSTNKHQITVTKARNGFNAICWMGRGREDQCDIVLTAHVNGERTVIGGGSAAAPGPHAHRIVVRVTLDEVGQALLAVRHHGHLAVIRASGKVEGTDNWMSSDRQIHLSQG